jgi:hypothetical protein
MPSRRAASSSSPARKPASSGRSQISGRGKEAFIRDVLQSVRDLDEDMAAEIAQHLCGAIDAILADRTLIERYRKPPFDPNAFSLMKVYRGLGERGLREKLRAIEESRHLQALAQAQQISLPRHLRNPGADVAGLKEAIVKGVISRHEDWQAAS